MFLRRIELKIFLFILLLASSIIVIYFCLTLILGSVYFERLDIPNSIHIYPDSLQIGDVTRQSGHAATNHWNTVFHWARQDITQVKSFFQEFAFQASLSEHPPIIGLTYYLNEAQRGFKADEVTGCRLMRAPDVSEIHNCFEVLLLNLSHSEALNYLEENFPEIESKLPVEALNSGTLIQQGWWSINY